VAKFLWTQRSNFGPSARTNHAMTFDSQRGRTVLFGGFGTGDAILGDTWEWDGSFWTQMDDVGPGPRAEHAMVYDSARQASLLFGGRRPPTPTPPTTPPTWGTPGSGTGRLGLNLQTPVRFRAAPMEWRSTAAEIGPCFLEARHEASRPSWIPGSSMARIGLNRQTPVRQVA
jgi:hypothetical protein